MMRLLAVLGSGGHTAQVVRLVELLGDDFEYAYLVGYGDFLSLKKISRSGDVCFVHRARDHSDGLLKTSVKVARLFVESFVAFLRIRPDAVVSAGVGMSVPISIICKLLGKRVIFIEDWSRIYRKSNSGRIAYFFSDLFFVQWKEMLKHYPRSIYAGRLA